MGFNLRHYRTAGFTIIEIAIAVAVLSISLVTVLGLQSSIIRSTITTQNTQTAMLLARRILAVIETTDESVEVGDTIKPADELIKDYLGSGNIIDAEDDQAKNFSAEISVQYWPIPDISEKALKRINLDIWRNEVPEDKFSVTYFIPNEDDPDVNGETVR